MTIAQDSSGDVPESSVPGATPDTSLDPGAEGPVDDPEPATHEAASVATRAVNTDAVELVGASGHMPLTAGQQRELALTYAVTTPRIETVVTAELLLSDSSSAAGWQVHLRAGQGEWSGVGPRADLAQTTTVDPGTRFEIALRITAPTDETADHTVELHISSQVINEHGALEAGIDPHHPPIVTLSVVPAPSTEIPPVTESDGGHHTGIETSVEAGSNVSPGHGSPTPLSSRSTTVATPEPDGTEGLVDTIALVAGGINPSALVEADSSLACDVTEPAAVPPGGHVDLACAHVADDTGDGILVTASFSEAEGDGWQLAIGEVGVGEIRFGPAGESATWEPAQGEGVDTDLIVRVFVPSDADSSHRATIDVYTGQQQELVATWNVEVSDEQVVSLASTACYPAVEFTNLPVVWHTPILVNDRPFESEIAYQVTAQESCAWSVTLSATAFTYSGSHGGEHISSSALEINSIWLSAGEGIGEVQTRGRLSIPRVVLSSDGSAPAGVTEHGLRIVLTLPAEAVPGHYQSTLTVTVTVAEDLDPGG